MHLGLHQILTVLFVFGLSAFNSLAVLPPTPSLPKATIPPSITISNGARLWLQQYNQHAPGIPIVFIHGGGGYSAYFGGVIKEMVAAGRHCIAVDRRGHGHSTFLATDVWTFEMFANEIHLQLKNIGVFTSHWVGWSDGAATTYAALQNPIIDATISKAYVFAGFMVPEDGNPNYIHTPIYSELSNRVRADFARLQPSASVAEFGKLLYALEKNYPRFTVAGLGRINGKKVAVVYAEHDEAVNLNVPAKLHAAIRGSTLIQLTGVTHFAPMQNPIQFSNSLKQFLG